MTNYMFNVFMAFTPYLSATVFLAIAYTFASKMDNVVIHITETEQPVIEVTRAIKAIIKSLIVGIVIIGLFVTLTSPSLTYKNKTFNSTKDNQEMTMQIMEEAQLAKDKPLKSIGRQPDQTRTERKSEFDDLVNWKKQN